MIVKIIASKNKNFRKLLEYILNDKDKLFNEKKKSFVITYNLKGNSVQEWEKQYLENEKCRKIKRTDSVIFTHEILTWHKDDAQNLSLEKMEDMAREYIRLRNPMGIFLAAPHFDKEHYHVHICASGIEYKTGKGLRMTKADFQKLKKDIQQYQKEKYPELSKSVVHHGKEKKVQAPLTDKEYQMKLRTGRATQKEQLIVILNSCYEKATSRENFFELLKESGLKTYKRGGKTTGIVYCNKKFRLKRIGFDEERIEELNKSLNRGKELTQTRGKKEKNIERKIEIT